MLNALVSAIAETAADVLGRCSDAQGGVFVSDEAIRAHLWSEREFRYHDALVALINYVRRLLDDRVPATPIPPPYQKPVQLSLNLEAV